jgi:putative transposase
MIMNYPLLLTDTQYLLVRKFFAGYRRKRKASLKIILSAVLYLLKSGCQWRMLPLEYGPWQRIYYYYSKWMRSNVLELLLKTLVRDLRRSEGRSASPSAAVIDTQAVKITAGTSEQVGWDGAKRVKGRKRSLLTDTMGNPLAVGVGAANLHDKKAVLTLKEQAEKQKGLKAIYADSGFSGISPFDRKGKIKWLIVGRRGGPFKILPKRWVVERTLSWLINFRRLSKDYEKLVQSSKTMILLACIFITLKKLIT